MEEIEPETVNSMLLFLYENHYPKGERWYSKERLTPGSTIATEVLLSHIKVSAIADYYDIKPLIQYANWYIEEIFLDWKFEGISSIRSALGTTTDKKLHEIIASGVAKYVKRVVLLGDSFLEDFMSYLAVPIMQHLITIHKATEGATEGELEKTRSKLEEFQLHCKNLQSNIQMGYDAQAEREEILEVFDRLRATLNTSEDCQNRHCRAQFNCYLEEYGLSPSDCMLRCSRCNCRLRR